MNTNIESRKIYLSPSGAYACDSLFSKLSFNIPQLFSRDRLLISNTIKILHVEIPFSWYIINSNNDLLDLSTGSINLNHGNYNANSFMSLIQPLLPINMLISFNQANGIFTLTYIANFSILETTTCYKLIGCAKNTLYTSTTNNLILPYPGNFLGTKNLYINIPNMKLDNYNTSTKTYTTLLSVAVDVPPFGIIIYENNNNNCNTVKGVKDDTLQIEILDDDFNEINFNNIEWNITIEIDTIKQLSFIPNSSLNN